MKLARRAIFLFLGFLCSTTLLAQSGNVANPLPSRAVGAAHALAATPPAKAVLRRLGSLPLRFEPNQGQVDPQVKYLAHGPGYTLFLTADEAVLKLAKPVTRERSRSRTAEEAGSSEYGSAELESTVVRMRLAGADPKAAVEALSLQRGTSNYFLGNDRKKWRTGVPGYARVSYHGIYPGIDLVFYGNPQRLEYDFTAAPGADPRKIELAFEGAEKIERLAGGDLQVSIGGEKVTIHKPLVYQGEKSKPIDAQFVLRAENRAGFILGAYDHSKALTIDPVLTYSSYLGGDFSDLVRGIALDSVGNIVLTGATQSPSFPVTGGTLQGNSDLFITKLEPLGRFLVYSTFVGGSGDDGDFNNFSNHFLALDGSDNNYVVGSTSSTDFPTVSAVQPTYGGGTTDTAVFELSADGQHLLFSTYLGGSGNDDPAGLTLDSAGNIVLGGSTGSADFPTITPLRTIAPDHGIYTWTGADPWVQINTGLNVRTINSVAVDPTSSLVLYASTTGGGVYKSNDRGAHWSASGLNNVSARAVAIDPITPANLYAAVSGGMYKSTDGGINWSRLVTFGARNTFSVSVNPANPNIVLGGAANFILQSLDAGATWANVTPSGVNRVHKFAIDPHLSSRIYAATDSGLYVSSDSGATWTLLTTPFSTAISVAIDPSNSNVVYAGSNDNNGTQGLYKSTDGGVTWSRLTTPDLFMRDVVTSPVHPDTVYLAVFNAIMRSSNGGVSFNPQELPGLSLPQLAVVGSDGPDTLYTGTLGSQGYVTKLSPGGAGITYSTYIPGNRGINVLSVAADPAGNAIAAGSNTSDAEFPLVNAFQSVNSPGATSCSVTKINSAGSAFVYSTLLGGSAFSGCYAAAVDPTGNAYLTGSTSQTDFPSVNAAQNVFGGFFDLFVTKFSPAGTVLYSTLWGGAGDEDGRGLYVDPDGNLNLTGDTGSINFPLVNPIQSVPGFTQNDNTGTNEDAVVMKLNPSGQVLFSTYLGGTGFDNGGAITANANGDVYVAGLTFSGNFPLAGQPFQSFDGTEGGGTNFVSKIAFFPPIVTLSTHNLDFGPVTVNTTSAEKTVTLTNTGTGPLLFGNSNNSPGPVREGSHFFVSDDCPHVLPAGAFCTGHFTFVPPDTGPFNDFADINNDAADSPQIINLTGTGVFTFPADTITPSALHFGDVGVNFTSPGLDVTITSTGTAPLIFFSFTTSDPQFAISNNTCPAALVPGASCTVTVDVTPAATGPVAGNLSISDNASEGPQQVSLDANGTTSITVTQTLSPTAQNTFTFPGTGDTFSYGIQFPPGTNFSGVTATVTAGFTSTTNFQNRVAGTFPGAQCIVYDGGGGNCTVFQVKCDPSPCPSVSGSQIIVVKTAFDSSQPIVNPGFLQASSGTNAWTNIFTEFLLPKIDGTTKGGTKGFSDFVAVNLPPPAGVPAGTFGGFKAPLAPKNPRRFERGEPIPVRFQVTAGGTFVTNVTAKLTLTKGTTQMPVKLIGKIGTPPNVFKYIAILHEYDFFLDTRGLPAGQYQLTVFSNSFAAQQVTFTLRRDD